MTIIVTMHRAKTELSNLIHQAVVGEEVVIIRGGRPITRLVSIRQERVAGSAQGKVRIGDDFDEPLSKD